LPPQTPITILLARFDDLLASGLRELILSDASLQLVARDVAHGRLSAVLRAHRPGVAILDVDVMTSLSEVRELRTRHPTTKLVLLANEPSMSVWAPSLAFGASACLGRDTQSRDILSAVHLAARGLQVIPQAPPTNAAGLGTKGSLLTPREAEVLLLLQQGRANAQIALALGVGVETIRTHARNIYRKLGVSSRRELHAPADRLHAATPIEVRRYGPLAPRARRGHGHGVRR
jgi:DNA-binding NarL/FixJ family response regulator